MSTEVGGIAFGLCLHFARNPGSVMFTDEICKRWSITPKRLNSALKVARRDGWLIGNKTEEGELYLCAGPKLEDAR